jgi:hypothetical protein
MRKESVVAYVNISSQGTPLDNQLKQPQLARKVESPLSCLQAPRYSSETGCSQMQIQRHLYYSPPNKTN